VVCPVAEERVFGAGHMAEQRGPGRRVMRTRRGSDAAAAAAAGCRGIGFHPRRSSTFAERSPLDLGVRFLRFSNSTLKRRNCVTDFGSKREE